MSVGARHLRMLLAIAEQGTITRAADQLHLTQPALTRALKQLERHLGVQLVDRTTRHLRMTDAGEAYLERARHALAVLDAVLDPAVVDHGPLRVGYAWSALGELTTAVVARWRAEHPETPLELHRIDDRLAGLRGGSVDASIVRALPSITGIERAHAVSEPRVAALPTGHRLARADRLVLDDLASEPIVVNTVSGTTTPELWPSGQRPKELVEVANTDEWLLAIAARSGIGISGMATAQMHPAPGVTFVPLTDAPPIEVEIAWRPPAHPAIASFAEIVSGTVAETLP